MPGERLMCVWEAAFAQNPQTSDKQLTKKGLNDVVILLDELPSIQYSKREFEEHFKSSNDVNIASFHRYLFDILAQKGSPQCMIQQEVENKCWEISKTFHCSKPLKESLVKKLWEICNRLADVNSFPPQISSGVADWFVDKVGTHLDKKWKSKTTRQVTFYTFSSLLDRLVDCYFSEETLEAICSCVNELHSWLVLEVVKSGWLFKRTKTKANWTNWIKRWFVLSSTRLSFYEDASFEENRKLCGEVLLTGSKVEPMSPYKGALHKLNGRFKVSNLPYVEMELATKERSQTTSWINSIEEAIDASKRKTTPIQRLLKERWGNGPADMFSNLEKSELQNADAIPVIHPESVAQIKTMSNQNTQGQKLFERSPSTNTEDSLTKADEPNLIQESTDKIKAVFLKIDTNGNGKIDEMEFQKFISELGLKLSDHEIIMLFNSVMKDDDGYISFQEFSDYFANVLLDETVGGEIQAQLRGAFLSADRDGTGMMNFNEYAEYLWDKKRSIRMSSLLEAFNQMDKDQDGQISYDQFREFYKNRMSSIPEIVPEDAQDQVDGGLNAVDCKLKEFYNNTDSDDLAQFVRERWNKFDTFKRYGASGELAMTGGEGMVDDIVPGEYSLIDLACFSDLPPLVPKHTTIKGVRWESSNSKGISGKLIFPKEFDGVLITDTATSEHLRYYGCSFAEGNQIKVSLLYRHGIQDFTYENQYLEDYVTQSNGGSGVEKHDFSHIDCPLEEDSGVFILGKFVGNDELHLTGFSVPVRHTLYIPKGVIHSNDYLKGTWRTMLSDEADIDHVHLVKATAPKQFENFTFEFA